MKVSVFRMSAEGEQVNVEIQVPDKVRIGSMENPRILDAFLAPVFRVVDARLIEMNKRIVAAKAIVAQYPQEVRMAVREVVDIIHGNVPDAQLKAILKQAEEKGQGKVEEVPDEQPAPTPVGDAAVSEEPTVEAEGVAGEIVPE